MVSLLDWVRLHRGGKSLQDSVEGLFLQPLYTTQGENQHFRIFKHMANDVQGIVAKVETDITACMSTWRNVQKSDGTRLLCLKWHASSKIFAYTGA